MHTLSGHVPENTRHVKPKPPRTEMISEVHEAGWQNSDGICPKADKGQERLTRTAQWQAGFGRQAGSRAFGQSCRRRHPSGSRKLGRARLSGPCEHISASNVQDANTSVVVVQSEAAAAEELRGCPYGQSERGERLEGEQSPREQRVSHQRKRRLLTTDSMEEQSHEVERIHTGNDEEKQRQDGNGCGDAVRLPEREKLRRV